MEDFDLPRDDYADNAESVYNRQIRNPVIRLGPDGKTKPATCSWHWRLFIERFLCGKCEITRDVGPRQRQNRDNAVVRGESGLCLITRERTLTANEHFKCVASISWSSCAVPEGWNHHRDCIPRHTVLSPPLLLLLHCGSNAVPRLCELYLRCRRETLNYHL